MTPQSPPRVFLFPAFEASIVGVLRRGPSKLWHVLRWDLDAGRVESGSWFRGSLYPMRTDVSFDGRWMVFNAYNADNGWGGICELPWLKTLRVWENPGNYGGGGYWRGRDTLIVDRRSSDHAGESRPMLGVPAILPFRAFEESLQEEVGWPRLRRDGWIEEDGFWQRRPTPSHPSLILSGSSEPFRFELREHPHLLDISVTDATWDSQGHLIVARAGWLERYSLSDFERRVPSFRYDLNPLRPAH